MKTEGRLRAALRAAWVHQFEPVDIASLVFFRVAFGLLLLVEVCRYFAFGWIKRFYVDPTFHFTYYGFEWVQPLPGWGMYAVFAILGVLALCVLAGFWYRIATALFFIGFTYVFLLDEARYLNHFYLISLVSFLLIFVPANRAFSLDVRLKNAAHVRTIPRWGISILRLQFAIMYIYAGIAKIDGDWVRGWPMHDMLAANSSLPLVGPHLTDWRVVLLFAWGGLLFDLTIVPLLLWPKTRIAAVVWAAAFHTMNNSLFHIGIFPWFAMAGTLLFLEPDWPRRLFSRWIRPSSAETRTKPAKQIRKLPAPAYSGPVVAMLAVYFALQILVPLRHVLYRGDASWTDEGQRFAWRMMLREKKASGRMVAVDHLTRQVRVIDLRDLERGQQAAMWIQPDMILQYAHYAAERLRLEGWQNVDVRANVHASLDGRAMQMFVDPRINLAEQPRTLMNAEWILPLTQPLPGLTTDDPRMAGAVQDGAASRPATKSSRPLRRRGGLT